MFGVVVITLVIAVVGWFSYNVVTKGKAQLKSVEACISQIERNPNSPSVYDKFIEVWKSSTWVQSEDLFIGGYYDRILKICDKNSSNVKAWQLLEYVVQKLNIIFGINVAGKRNRAITFRLLADNLFKEFKNQPIRERILSLIHLVSGITQAETNTSLKILEANLSSQEAKMLVLDLGRLHYSVSRPDKKPTIYDEQAIQNDIIVRSK
ncbi:hypothetical protein A6770_13115 [Nostoc minutum NIES-26]|uniref:Uncharacterized protein n=1 Tax=Nostoc minutum NIES-26 TaxID=1844469 RepID=A0A367RQI0_9NOSO|nr:hypothetical protein A6770_13115 [Nostoc minutum NIES-26]